MRGRSLLGLWLLISVGGALAQSAATPVAKLDLKQFAGKWYELERLPAKSEKDCVADALVLYGLRDKAGHFSVVNGCRTKDETDDSRNFIGWMDGKAGDGKLKVRYTWPFTHPYWVLGIGPDYAWALVGSPNHKELKLLSRTPTLPAETLTTMRAQATGQGFDVSKLVVSSQTGQRMMSTERPAAETGK